MPGSNNKASDKVDELITLISRWLFLNGKIIAPGPNLSSIDDVPATTPSQAPLDPTRPIASQVLPTTSLTDTLTARDHDLAACGPIAQQIQYFHNNAALIAATHARLCQQHHALVQRYPGAGTPLFADKPLLEKVAILRRLQHAIGPWKQEQTFQITVVRSLSYVGLPTDSCTLHLALDISWAHFNTSLQDATICPPTTALGYETGYSLDEGFWLVQVFANGRPNPKKFYALSQPRHLHHLVSALGVQERQALVWHERIWKEMWRRRERAQKESWRWEEGEIEPKGVGWEFLLEAEFDEGRLEGMFDAKSVVEVTMRTGSDLSRD